MSQHVQYNIAVRISLDEREHEREQYPDDEAWFRPPTREEVVKELLDCFQRGHGGAFRAFEAVIVEDE